MAGLQRRCEWCHEPFVASRRTARFCSNACRQAHWRYVHGRTYRAYVLADGGARESAGRPVGEEEIADAVVRIRSAVATISAGRLTGPPELRPLCSRLEDGLLAALDREGL